ncbi:uncharacterized protein VTP21DRAFT_452 [Calcarisporiella thermophila]|uniref:uncharacterized protein n=1 Tax=Calcarisporiella thermophila TaxID=911321 RepID=UPI00374305DD
MSYPSRPPPASSSSSQNFRPNTSGHGFFSSIQQYLTQAHKYASAEYDKLCQNLGSLFGKAAKKGRRRRGQGRERVEKRSIGRSPRMYYSVKEAKTIGGDPSTSQAETISRVGRHQRVEDEQWEDYEDTIDSSYTQSHYLNSTFISDTSREDHDKQIKALLSRMISTERELERRKTFARSYGAFTSRLFDTVASPPSKKRADEEEDRRRIRELEQELTSIKQRLENQVAISRREAVEAGEESRGTARPAEQRSLPSRPMPPPSSPPRRMLHRHVASSSKIHTPGGRQGPKRPNGFFHRVIKDIGHKKPKTSTLYSTPNISILHKSNAVPALESHETPARPAPTSAYQVARHTDIPASKMGSGRLPSSTLARVEPPRTVMVSRRFETYPGATAGTRRPLYNIERRGLEPGEKTVRRSRVLELAAALDEAHRIKTAEIRPLNRKTPSAARGIARFHSAHNLGEYSHDEPRGTRNSSARKPLQSDTERQVSTPRIRSGSSAGERHMTEQSKI